MTKENKSTYHFLFRGEKRDLHRRMLWKFPSTPNVLRADLSEQNFICRLQSTAQSCDRGDGCVGDGLGDWGGVCISKVSETDNHALGGSRVLHTSHYHALGMGQILPARAAGKC